MSLATAKKNGAEGIHALRQTPGNEYRQYPGPRRDDTQ